MTPKFSIITCTYNREDLIGRAIKSALNQTYKNFELIIIDDGSTDNTPKIVSLFKDKRIKYHQFENRGELCAKNRGLSLAKGDYLVFLDSDDELVDNALQTAIDGFNAKESTLGILLFNILNIESKKISGKCFKKDGEYVDYKDIICRRIDGDFCRFFKRRILTNEMFDERLVGGLLFWLELHKKSKCVYLEKPVYLAHRGGSDRMSNFNSQLRNIKRIILSNQQFLDLHGKNLERYCSKEYGRKLMILGFWQILNGEKKNGRNNLKKSLKYMNKIVPLTIFFLSLIFSVNTLRKIFGWIITNTMQKL